MPRALLPVLLFVCSLAAPAHAGWRAQTSGDSIIDAQWAGRTVRPPAAYQPGTVARPTFFKPAPVRRQKAVEAPRELDPAFLPAVVDYPTSESAGTIVIDTSSRYLYLVLDGGKAQRYGVGVGREGFGWSGTVHVGRKEEWPTWTPPAEMRQRQPYLPVSMAGGPDNPLGARAMYLYDESRDTLFRIHGSNEPWTIGHAVSSGCFRMRNEDVLELYGRVGIGTKVVVM
jgi:lipoprotein-anchoring transpeptidase ErfK/SrfK